MLVQDKVIKKILKEKEKYLFDEFGGWLVVTDDVVSDIVFDVKENNPGYVKFDMKNLMSIDKEQRKYVKGWFHQHPITGLSQMDVMTTFNATRFWNECYTLVWQSNDKLLFIKTKMVKDFIFPDRKIVVEEESKEIDLNDYREGGIFE